MTIAAPASNGKSMTGKKSSREQRATLKTVEEIGLNLNLFII
jgi:hypothetical protein